ncbi:RNA polymerase sigma factor [Baekduia alba]|uniref:RNA polymerase sigma factor n=1 Tax=Baekduia alba TaxID=2997333 RepID=UPI00233FC700|nr:RNA polymerase sigma factor [Baekduia alba]WCB96363.1 RNA polymerase sigma factor [Baekduia alba]
MAAIDTPPPALPPSMLAAMGDSTLVNLIAAGSDDAFAALDARYRSRLVRFARGFVPGGTADAEDVVQDALVRAVRALRNGSRPEALGPWLHRITRNCALDLNASRRRHPVVELVDHAHPPAEDAATEVERSLGMRKIVADVGRLPDTQRSALVLRELEGRSYADIADELDTTVPAVKSLLVRARQGLRRARDDRRVAAWLPLPILGRIAERVGTLWEPVAASATPKVACAAVVAVGSLPVMAGKTPVPINHHTAPKHAQAAATPKPPAPVTRDTPDTPAPKAKAVAAAPAGKPTSSIATVIPTALRQDCADGTIDGHYAQSVLNVALERSADNGGSEYGSCRQALMQARLQHG